MNEYEILHAEIDSMSEQIDHYLDVIRKLEFELAKYKPDWNDAPEWAGWRIVEGAWHEHQGKLRERSFLVRREQRPKEASDE